MIWGNKRMQDKTENFKLSYQFFVEKMKTKQPFTLKELSDFVGSGWSESTPRTYLSKKWKGLLTKVKQGYVVNTDQFVYSEDEYCRMMSQSRTKSDEPFKPELSDNIECLVEKAHEAAILAIDIYNRPMTSFRSQGFIVMMIIAWTSLLHAIFEKEDIVYYYLRDGKPEIIDGDKKAWELATCIDKCSKLTEPIKTNIKFFIRLRNKIEHRYAPMVDMAICGECQSLLYNFESLLTAEFGIYYSLNNTLSIPLQVITQRATWQTESMKKYQAKHYNELKEYIDTYRSELSEDIFASPEYCFRVYLIPKTGNHATSSDVSMEFVKYDPTNAEQFAGLEQNITLIKDRIVQVANQGKLKPSDVCKAVSVKIGKTFNVSDHTKAWKYYKVRKQGYQGDGCNIKYCQFDDVHHDYIYTQDWVDFLVAKLSNDDEYSRIKAYR